MQKRLYLYVWEDVLCDYTCGMAFAIASSEEEAIKLLTKKAEHELDLRNGKMTKRAICTRCAYLCYGGG